MLEQCEKVSHLVLGAISVPKEVPLPVLVGGLQRLIFSKLDK